MGKPWFLITGCDSGFGMVTAKKLAEAGYNVFAGVLKPTTAYDGIPNITTVVMDVTCDQSVEEGFKLIKQKLGSDGVLKGVVNNAGLMYDIGPVEWMPVSHLTKMFKVNVEGTARVTKAALPFLRQCQGRVVNIASILGRITFPLQTYYSASKHAVEGYSDGLRREVKSFGVTVSVVEPGVYPMTGLYATYYDGFERCWGHATEEVQSAYGDKWKQRMQKDITRTPALIGNKNIEDVPNAVLHALTAPAPLIRYRCGYDSKFTVPILSRIPDHWLDNVLRLPRTAQTNTATYDYKARYVLLAAAAAYGLAKL
eukprot:TRINITY_DN46749_c0_g1_i1.p1 TRINITY_DN46749_c0_g1~~TRINITY_DN46749_c0_g1_i1.p1  ORF type:complete len:312 (+),score=96.51 TRINITY_DN46749_c0_g1_i1:35-970(+)